METQIISPRQVFIPQPTEIISPRIVAPQGTGLSREERIRESIINPDLFARDFLQSELWDTQAEILRAIATYPRVAVKACHASSKTYTAARVVLWFLACHAPEAVVVTTAPTWGQVEKLLWGEVHSALAKSRYPFPEATLTGLKMGPKRYAYGLSTSVTKSDEGVKFQGIHAANVLIILDEAPGVDPKIWTAIEGARAGGNVKILAIGNPTISSGPFHDAFTVGRDTWKCFTISAFGTPNLKGIDIPQLMAMTEDELDTNSCPYLTTRRWVKEKYIEWGPGHPLWEARVLGEFPQQSEDSLLSLAWLEQAKIRDQKELSNAKITAGIDVAGPGEAETVLTIRRGGHILHHQAWPISDPRGEIVSILNKYKPVLSAVNVDAVGIGWYVYKHLEELKFPANPIIAQGPTSDSEKYKDEKAEFYWGLRLRFQDGDISGLTDEKTIGQLASIRYKHNARGQVEIESKEDALKRGVKSPDRAESIMLAFADRVAIYGALDYFKEVGASMQKISQSTQTGVMMPENALTCEKCQSKCLARTNGQWRCGNCGYQFSGPGDTQIIQRSQGRGEVLAKIGNPGTRGVELEH